VLGGVLAVSLGGCTSVVTGHATAEPSSIGAGRCYTTNNPEALSPGNLVDCDADHNVEVLAVRRLPTDLASRDRRDLMSSLSGPSELFGPHAREVCDDALLTSSGLADALDLPEDPEQRRALAVTPLASVWGFVTVPQQAFWSQGERTVVCGVAYTDKRGYPDSFAADGGEPMFSAFATSGYRADLRWCERDSDELDSPPTIVGCDDPHDWELIFEFDAGAVLDPDMLPLIDPAAETSGQFRLLARECRSLAPELLRWGLAEAEIVGWPANDWGTPRTAGGAPEHRALCGVLSPADQLIVGSVFDEDVRLVPR
jgi:hypothetical protein